MPLPPVTPTLVKPLSGTPEFDQLQYEHKEVLELGKFFYSSIYKLAPMSFTLNGVLLTALHFLITTRDKLIAALYVGEIIAVGTLGVVYNFGALFAYISCSTIATRLTTKFIELDDRLGFEIGRCRVENSTSFGTFCHRLTIGFFVLLIVFWAVATSMSVYYKTGLAGE